MEMRLIDADELGVGRCNPDVMVDKAYAAGWNGVVGIINNAPTIDPLKAIGGCRCGECKYHAHDEEYDKHWCNLALSCRQVKVDGYCDQGKPKEADHERMD